VKDVRLLGRFQLENVTAATMAAALAGIAPEHIAEGIKSFTGLPYRLEFRGEKRGIKFYNDSFATIPESSVAALSAFENVPGLMIILGGSSKNSDYTMLAEKICEMKNIKKIFFLGTVAGPEIYETIERVRKKKSAPEFAAGIYDHGNTSLEMIFEKVKSVEQGDVLLLSPACASFDLFPNYKVRGNVFNQLVEAFK
jgi:UDP-N-acetylmuramoylalanine--D-glutamate ligase